MLCLKLLHLPWHCPSAAIKTQSLVPTNNSPYPEVMLSVVKEKPHFPVSMRKEHLLQRNDIWMLELPQQLQKKKSTTYIMLYTYIQSWYTWNTNKRSWNLQATENHFFKWKNQSLVSNQSWKQVITPSGHSFPTHYLKAQLYVNLIIIQDQDDSANSQLWHLPFCIGCNLQQSYLGYPIFSSLPIIWKTCIFIAVSWDWMGWLM